MKILSSSVKAVAIAGVVALSACGDSPFQVIEELDFDPSLSIDLAEFERTSSGLYRQDVLVGDGFVVQDGSVPTVLYIGWLADGTQFGQGSFAFVVGSGSVIAGFEEGVFGMKVGGVRRIIIPPELGYGDAEQDAIPAGSVLVFQITVDSMEDPEGSQGPPASVVGISR